MNFLYKSICSVFGLGYIPWAPGTFGSLGGLLSAWLIKEYLPYPNFILILFIIFFTFVGVHFSNKLIPQWGRDPSRIVIDEVVGIWISVWLLQHNVFIFVSAFVLFRVLDIWKPFMIRRLEKIPGGWGIMLDDIAAGILTNVVLQILCYFYYV